MPDEEVRHSFALHGMTMICSHKGLPPVKASAGRFMQAVKAEQ